MRVAVTGPGGRLGRAVMAALTRAGHETLAMDRRVFDLDAPAGIGAVLDELRPELVVHAAAWTDVDGCAREPELAMRRNGEATGIIAAASSARRISLLAISTNEVFDGEGPRRPHAPLDSPRPANPYGASKLAGERAATDAYASAGAEGSLGIARTAWLFGPGAPDFPRKIAAAAARARTAGEPLRVVADEFGTPTYVEDVAEGIAALVSAGTTAGIHHLVNGGEASRAEWARDVLERLGLEAVDLVDVGLADFPRPSRPPRWGVLEPTPVPAARPSGGGATRFLRPWREAMAAYAPALRESVTMSA